jgi:hypothetical protein
MSALVLPLPSAEYSNTAATLLSRSHFGVLVC